MSACAACEAPKTTEADAASSLRKRSGEFTMKRVGPAHARAGLARRDPQKRAFDLTLSQFGLNDSEDFDQINRSNRIAGH